MAWRKKFDAEMFEKNEKERLVRTFEGCGIECPKVKGRAILGRKGRQFRYTNIAKGRKKVIVEFKGQKGSCGLIFLLKFCNM